MDEVVLQIYDLLYQLGVTARYVGFFYVSYALQLCVKQPERLRLVTKWVYPDVARQYNTNWRAVARDITTVGNVIWKQNRPLLEKLARRPLKKKPENTQLLAILVSGLSPPDPERGKDQGVGVWACVHKK